MIKDPYFYDQDIVKNSRIAGFVLAITYLFTKDGVVDWTISFRVSHFIHAIIIYILLYALGKYISHKNRKLLFRMVTNSVDLKSLEESYYYYLNGLTMVKFVMHDKEKTGKFIFKIDSGVRESIILSLTPGETRDHISKVKEI